jgi:CheY-like chemotaxis protein
VRATGERRKPRVLIVEDTLDSRELYNLHLRDAGWEVDDAANGAEALTLASTFEPDAIVMDLNMPVMDGIEATRLLKKNPRTRHIPIVALTAFADPVRAIEARYAGCQIFLAKPCLPERLLLWLECLLSRGRHEA